MTIASPTFGDLIDSVLGQMRGWILAEDQRTTLTTGGGINSAVTSFTVADATQISAGAIEIDSELLWVQSVDRTTNIITIASWGRGYLDTAPASHAANAMVTSHPKFPRGSAAKAIQQTIFAVYPDLFQIKDDVSNISVPVQISYPVAADCDMVLHVGWPDPGPSGLEITARRWRFNTQTQKVDIFSGMSAGRTIRITYQAIPGQLSAETDLLSSTGLLDSVQDVLIFGACYRLVPALEMARLNSSTIQQSANAQQIQGGQAINADRYYLALYEQALQREVLRLQKLLPTQGHMER